MICPRCSGNMEQKMMPFVTKRKKVGESHIIGTQMVWFCRDCKVSAEIRQTRA